MRYCECRGVVPRQQVVIGELSRGTASRHNENRRGSHRRRTAKAGQQDGQQAEQPHPMPPLILGPLSAVEPSEEGWSSSGASIPPRRRRVSR